MHAVGEQRERWIDADAIAIGLHGAAGYNLANAAGAAATAHALGVPREAIVTALTEFDRDATLRALGHEIAAMAPDHVVLHDKPEYLRGRRPGEVPAILQQGLLEAGIATEAIEHAADELAAIACARAWTRPGDLVAVFAHTERTPVV